MSTSRMFTTALFLFSALLASVFALPAGHSAAIPSLSTRQDADKARTGYISEPYTAGSELQALILASIHESASNSEPEPALDKRQNNEITCNWPSSAVSGNDVASMFPQLLNTPGTWNLGYLQCVTAYRGTIKTSLCGAELDRKRSANNQEWAQWYGSIIGPCFNNGGGQVGMRAKFDRQMFVLMERN